LMNAPLCRKGKGSFCSLIMLTKRDFRDELISPSPEVTFHQK
jgi:hypothetical protein